MAEETTENSYLESMLSQLEEADISNPAAMKVKMLLDMLPSEDKSAGENIFDIVSMHPGIAGVLPGKFTGGSRLNTETRESVMDFYKETKGGAFLENLSDETLAALNANKAKIIAAAARDKQSSRQGLKRVIELMGWD